MCSSHLYHATQRNPCYDTIKRSMRRVVMHTPFKRHLLELNERHLIELTAFAREYGGDGFGATEDAFPHSSADVLAATAMCFDGARQALDAAQTGARVRENMRFPSTEHVASVA